jgi:CDP-diacylglycerol pyrophosphatase
VKSGLRQNDPLARIPPSGLGTIAEQKLYKDQNMTRNETFSPFNACEAAQWTAASEGKDEHQAHEAAFSKFTQKYLLSFKNLWRFLFNAIFTLALCLTSSAADSDSLWREVHEKCVPHWVASHDPSPCEQILTPNGSENGVAILKDKYKESHFLAIATSRISGIESPALEGPAAPHLFEAAWEARRLVFDKLGEVLPRDNVGLAINSALRRSQDQVHIHIDCLKPEARDTVLKRAAEIGSEWSEEFFVVDAPYRARRIEALDLTHINPFDLVAEYLRSHGQELHRASIVVMGVGAEGNKPGFIVLFGLADESHFAFGHGENLLDIGCQQAK